MRYAALPPALVRGVPPVLKLVAGGVRIPGCRALNRIIFLYLPSLFLVLFCERYVGDELPPVPVCATLTTLSQVRGARRLTARLPKRAAKFQFAILLRNPICTFRFSDCKPMRNISPRNCKGFFIFLLTNLDPYCIMSKLSGTDT